MLLTVLLPGAVALLSPGAAEHVLPDLFLYLALFCYLMPFTIWSVMLAT